MPSWGNSTVEARLNVQPDPVEVAAARRFVADALVQWQAGHDRDTVVLLVSELVSNAVVHAGTEVVLVVRCEGHLLTVEVSDGSDLVPTPRHDPGASGGRGLALVEALSDAWGFRALPAGGKVVWFTLTGDERPARRSL